MSWTEFFSQRIPHIYLVYGLAFFALGLAVILEIGRAEPVRFNRAMLPLAFFGIVHGIHEWLEMFAIVGRQTYDFQPPFWFEVARLVILAVSFSALVIFGIQTLPQLRRLHGSELWIGLVLLSLYGVGVAGLGYWLKWRQPGWFAAADALARYSLAIPGAVLTAWALLAQRQPLIQANKTSLANNLFWPASAFFLYGIIGQLFIGASPLFPSTIINAGTFLNWFGIPIQLFRAIMAVIAAVSIVWVLRSFEANRQQALSKVANAPISKPEVSQHT